MRYTRAQLASAARNFRPKFRMLEKWPQPLSPHRPRLNSFQSRSKLRQNSSTPHNAGVGRDAALRGGDPGQVIWGLGFAGGLDRS